MRFNGERSFLWIESAFYDCCCTLEESVIEGNFTAEEGVCVEFIDSVLLSLRFVPEE